MKIRSWKNPCMTVFMQYVRIFWMMMYRFLEKKLGYKYTCKEILDTFSEKSFMPLIDRIFNCILLTVKKG